MASHFCPLKWNYQEISVFFKTYESSDAISSSSSSSCIVHTGEPVVVLLFHLASQESWMALSVHEIRISKIDGLTHSIFTFKGRSSFHQPSSKSRAMLLLEKNQETIIFPGQNRSFLFCHYLLLLGCFLSLARKLLGRDH